jgi:hypothetical protein
MQKPTKRQQEYWDNVLSEHNLGLDRGRAGKSQENGKRRLNHIGNDRDLEIEISKIITKKLGRKKPKQGAE